MTAPTRLIERYFALAAQEDTEPYFAQFDDDATAEDEGVTHRGIIEIRAWRTTVPPVSYRVVDVATDVACSVAWAQITGEFPGSPVTLEFCFVFTADGLIRSLAIRE